MRESDYILAGDLARVYALKHILGDIMPNDLIPEDEYRRVMRALVLWQQRMYCKVDPGDAKAKRELKAMERDEG